MKNLKGSTLIETIVAMMLIILMFALTLRLFSSNLDSENLRLKLSAHLILKKIAIDTQREKSFIDAQMDYGIFQVSKKIKYYPGSTDLAILELVVLNPGTNRNVAKRMDLILVK